MILQKVLEDLSKISPVIEAFVPGLWTGSSDPKPVKIDYSRFLHEKISEILNTEKSAKPSHDRDWTKKAIVYNIFPRFFTAYDHDQDGEIGQKKNDITVSPSGIRETGTFLKTIALLPYLKQLGINTIHLLPITEIGLKGRKGDLGSPYAIKNPFKIDQLLADPILDIGVDLQYKALIEAAHLLDIRVVQEFIFRTASIDSDWSQEHPEWFYWIDKNEKYEAPRFSASELEQIMKVPKGKGNYIPPSDTYRSKFKKPGQDKMTKSWTVASAFADWPPDDVQPPWSDVTYLRLYNYEYNEDNNYNYIAYNTIRYYDPVLAISTNANLQIWEKISDIIPHFQQAFGIDGAMIDMGHALPDLLKEQIIDKAREHDKSFAFWDENFDNKQSIKDEGYNAVVGDAWHKMTKRNGMKHMIESSIKSKALPFFGTPETHNSPRFGLDMLNKKKASWLLFNMIPDAIPFMHNGFELNEEMPVNTGLNFSEAKSKYYSKQRLPLFFKSSMQWDTSANIVAYVKKINAIRLEYPWIFDSMSVELITTSNPKVLGLQVIHQKQTAIALFNTNFHRKEQFEVEGDIINHYIDLIQGSKFDLSKTHMLEKGSVLLALRR